MDCSEPPIAPIAREHTLGSSSLAKHYVAMVKTFLGMKAKIAQKSDLDVIFNCLLSHCNWLYHVFQLSRAITQ